jgi:hypothetical protein
MMRPTRARQHPTCLVSPDDIDVATAVVWTNDWTRKRYRPMKLLDKHVSPGDLTHDRSFDLAAAQDPRPPRGDNRWYVPDVDRRRFTSNGRARSRLVRYCLRGERGWRGIADGARDRVSRARE